MAGLFTKTEKVNSCKSLVCLLQALTGRSTVIELRNELAVSGTISTVDSNMNVTLTKATLRKLNGESEVCEQTFIHGNQIRYVHVPEDVDVPATLETQVRMLLGSGVTHQRKRLSRARLNRQAEERAAVRAFKLGRGRAAASKSLGNT